LGVIQSLILEIRWAVPGDSEDCAELILESADQFLPAVFGPGIKTALARLSTAKGNLFSHEHTLVAVEGGERPAGTGVMYSRKAAGVLLGYTGADKAREDPRTGLLLLGFLGVEMLLRLPVLLRVQRAVAAVARGAFYVSNAAVRQQLRGRGIGAALFLAAEEEARRLGCREISLDVETGNRGAFKLYEKLGYAAQGGIRQTVVRGEEFSFYRMVKPLT
jgi:ribosomal protein S18 acetylase RimI-like enzyme